jgi:hypothetical protein
MRRPELIFLHSVSADGFDVPACDFQKLVALSREGPDPSLLANSAAQQKRFASRISSTLFATRSSRPAARRGQARSSAADRDVERLRDSKKEASRGTCGSSYWCCGAGTRSRNTDRQFWICASRWFPGWRSSLLIVKPETVCPAGGNCPVATVVISGNGEGDQTIESPEVKVSSWEASNSAGRSSGEPVSVRHSAGSGVLEPRHANGRADRGRSWACTIERICGRLSPRDDPARVRRLRCGDDVSCVG